MKQATMLQQNYLKRNGEFDIKHDIIDMILKGGEQFNTICMYPFENFDNDIKHTQSSFL